MIVEKRTKPKPETRQRTKVVGVRLLPSEFEALKRESIKRGISVASLLRDDCCARITDSE